jgi:5-methylcytosine-specific restriction enzyme subunit McrC
VTNGMFRMVQIHRNNRDYRFLMHVCRLIHNSLLVAENSGEVRFYDFRRDNAVMWAVFEDFVANFLAREQADFNVHIQSPMRWHSAESVHADTLKMLPQMKPDVVLESRTRRIVLDTKYSRRPLRTNRWGQQKIAPGHLYQIVAYIENRDLEKPDGPPHEGMLLYPVVEKPFRLEYILNGRKVQVRTVDLSQPWSAVAEEMLGLIAGNLRTSTRAKRSPNEDHL